MMVRYFNADVTELAGTLMRIDPKDTLFGYPTLEIRRLMREEQHSPWNLWLPRRVLGIGVKKALELVHGLEEAGYIEHSDDTGDEPYWQCTVKGNALQAATAARPVKRATADRVLAEFLGRVQAVRDDSYYLPIVHKVAVFGSYIGTAPVVNDVDVAVRLVRRESDPQQYSEMRWSRVEEAHNQGRAVQESFG